MSAQDETVMEDKNYVKVAQLYGIMKHVESNNSMAFESLLKKCKETGNLHLIVEDLLKNIDINYRVPATNFFKSTMPHLIGSTLLHLAAEKNNIQMFEMFIKKRADFTIKNDNGYTVVHQMIYKTPFKKYFDSVTDEGKLEQDPFVESVLAAHIEYENSSNPRDQNGVSHFSVACMTDNVKAVKFFLEHKVSLDETVIEDSKDWPGYTPLHFAAKYCAVEVAKILLKHDANPNTKDSRGMTPLQILLDQKMKIWRKKSRLIAMNKVGAWPETHAKQNTSLDLFLEKNEKISNMLLNNHRIVKDELAFYTVSTMKDSAIAKNYLKNNVVDLDRAIASDSPFYPGYTAAHFAAHFNPMTVKLLMKKGANMIVRDAKGVTPFDICFQGFKVEELYRLMESRTEWSEITFSDGKTRLMTVIGIMRIPSNFYNYLRRQYIRVDSYVQLDSPICAGYTPLDLAVTCAETCPIYWENRVMQLPRYLDRIKACLKFGADVTANYADGLTSVHRAFRLCENQVVSRLLQAQTTVVNPVDADGLSHFHIACIVNHKNFIKKLIDSGVGLDIPIRSSYKWYEEHRHSESYISSGSTPLHLMAYFGKLDTTKLLLKHNANVFAKDADGLTAVDRAVKRDRLEDLDRNFIISNLIGTGRDQIFNFTHDFDALCELLYRIPEHFTLSSFIIDDKKNHGRVIVDKSIMECILKKMGVTMLHLVCYWSTEISQIRELLDDGADVNAKVNEDSPYYPGSTPLHFAVRYQRRLLKNRSSVDLKMVSFLLNRGADVTISNCQQQTPIHEAFRFILRRAESNYAIADILLKSQKDYSINPKDSRGLSHFHLACYRNNKDIVYKFLSKGVNVNQSVDHFVDKFGGYSPLHFAMICPKKQVYSLLLKHGANVNARDRLGNTPLHVAVKCEKWLNEGFFNIFFSAGADPNAKDLMHESLLELLLKSHNVTSKAVASFHRNGARINFINPISREDCLIHAAFKFRDEKSIFYKLAKFKDAMNLDENGSTVFHKIIVKDTYAFHCDSISYRGFDAVTSWNILTVAQAIEILTKLNLNIDGRNRQGKTALQFAIENFNVDGVDGLLKNGADINVEIDASGKTSFTYITQVVNGDQRKIEILRLLTMHVQKLLFTKIYVNEANKDAYVKACGEFHTVDNSSFNAELKELEKQQVGSSLLTLRDCLSETDFVASYAYMKHTQRQEIHKFFNVNGVDSLCKRFPAMTSLLKLQYRKARARVKLLSSAAEALDFLTNEELKKIIASEVVI